LYIFLIQSIDYQHRPYFDTVSSIKYCSYFSSNTGGSRSIGSIVVVVVVAAAAAAVTEETKSLYSESVLIILYRCLRFPFKVSVKVNVNIPINERRLNLCGFSVSLA
jgi:hypothetical protein